ncbi:MAG: hypothetical protein JHC26_11790 [Thermofilum sp.]|jgi:hypothetical protein|uniref:hypothetical protein n=1 Tax=Thermofilum sp. TaxID=1961369 RepID=UPI0025831263|nr:hypothetical protein [Thermofilum sp.]MCI4409765.1 hypothetical protein [Thermofilum sp.]
MIPARYVKYPKRKEMTGEDDRVSEATIGDLIDFSNGLALKRPRFNCYVFTKVSSQPDALMPPDLDRMVEVIAVNYNFGVGITKEGKIKIRILVENRKEEFIVDLAELKKIMNIFVVKDCRPNVLVIEEIKARLGR